jgi:hypothetical protein
MELTLVILVGVLCFLSFSHAYYFGYVEYHIDKMDHPKVHRYWKRAMAITTLTTFLLIVVEVALVSRLLGIVTWN